MFIYAIQMSFPFTIPIPWSVDTHPTHHPRAHSSHIASVSPRRPPAHRWGAVDRWAPRRAAPGRPTLKGQPWGLRNDLGFGEPTGPWGFLGSAEPTRTPTCLVGQGHPEKWWSSSIGMMIPNIRENVPNHQPATGFRISFWIDGGE